MRRWTLLTAVVAVTVFPLVSIGALRVVMQPWIVHFEVDHGGLPADRYGFGDDDRVRLGLLGLRSIRPGGEGVAVLERTRLHDGTPAFGARELRHMRDVRAIVGVLLTVHTAVLAILAAAALLAWRLPAARAPVARGLRAGALGTVAVAAALGLVMLVAWDGFFDTFHRLFFTGDTWWFQSRDTLRRVYPDEFWMGVAAWITGLATLFTAIVLLGARRWLGRLQADGVIELAGASAPGDERSPAA